MNKEMGSQFGDKIKQLSYLEERRGRFDRYWSIGNDEEKFGLIRRAVEHFGLEKTDEDVLQYMIDAGVVRNKINVYACEQDKPSLYALDKFREHDASLAVIVNRVLAVLGVVETSKRILSNDDLVSAMGELTPIVGDDPGTIVFVKETNIPGVVSKIVMDSAKTKSWFGLDLRSISFELSPAAFMAKSSAKN